MLVRITIRMRVLFETSVRQAIHHPGAVGNDRAGILVGPAAMVMRGQRAYKLVKTVRGGPKLALALSEMPLAHKFGVPMLLAHQICESDLARSQPPFSILSLPCVQSEGRRVFARGYILRVCIQAIADGQPSGVKAGARGSAYRGGGQPICENSSLHSHAVYVWGQNRRMPIKPQVKRSEVVAKYKDNVDCVSQERQHPQRPQQQTRTQKHRDPGF